MTTGFHFTGRGVLGLQLIRATCLLGIVYAFIQAICLLIDEDLRQAWGHFALAIAVSPFYWSILLRCAKDALSGKLFHRRNVGRLRWIAVLSFLLRITELADLLPYLFYIQPSWWSLLSLFDALTQDGVLLIPLSWWAVSLLLENLIAAEEEQALTI